MTFEPPHSAYFIGAGGIGMSALARWMQQLGVQVYGYDRVRSAVARGLEEAGIIMVYDNSEGSIPRAFLSPDIQSALVVVTPAIPKAHPQLNYLEQNGYPIMKRSALLGELLKDYQCMAVAGTHGKTTTTCMLAHILKTAKIPVVGLLGGISVNYNSNFVFNENAQTAVVEADEFDRSFHLLSPAMAIITSCDADHLDIYGSGEELKKGFSAFIARVAPGGNLVINERANLNIPGSLNTYRYGSWAESDFRVTNAGVAEGAYRADFSGPGMELSDVRLAMPGNHNLENALAAAAVARLNGISAEAIKMGLETFRGVKRRFEKVCQTPRLVYIDDYAHHPKEIAACIEAARALYPGKKLTGIFQPHLYSRTRDFLDGFAASLSELDRVWLLEIYPAREEPLPGISSSTLLQRIAVSDKALCSNQEVIDGAGSLDGVLITLGAGDIDRIVAPIKEGIEV